MSGRTELVRRWRVEIAEALAEHRRAAGRQPSAQDERRLARRLLNERLADLTAVRLGEGLAPLAGEEEDALCQQLLDALFGLGPLERLLADPGIENINAIGADRTWITRADGTKEPGPPLAASDEDLIELVRRAAARLGLSERRFDSGSPALSLELPDGSRLFAVMAVSARPCLAVRRHRYPKVVLDDLVGLGMFDRRLAGFLKAAVRARRNLLVCGGTGAGKTTLLRALLNEVSAAERLVTIEDSFELGLDRWPDREVCALQSREPNVEGRGEISMAALVRMSLRMSPDRVIVGEVRGHEVLPMLGAMSQGADGSMCTVHADSSQGAFRRLAMYAVQAPERLPLEATNLLVANAVHLVVYIAQDVVDGVRRGRRVASIREVVDADGPMVISNEVFASDGQGRLAPAAPLRAPTLAALVAAGMDPAAVTGGRR